MGWELNPYLPPTPFFSPKAFTNRAAITKRAPQDSKRGCQLKEKREEGRGWPYVLYQAMLPTVRHLFLTIAQQGTSIIPILMRRKMGLKEFK